MSKGTSKEKNEQGGLNRNLCAANEHVKLPTSASQTRMKKILGNSWSQVAGDASLHLRIRQAK